jgi:hypothetical protein
MAAARIGTRRRESRRSRSRDGRLWLATQALVEGRQAVVKMNTTHQRRAGRNGSESKLLTLLAIVSDLMLWSVDARSIA